ncbi:MAG: glycoside hydrolase family 3 protein [Micromonosporaceae bacterium]|nr:glycoside hydrolase family 3 protein [Micromonosporaceae bacterium]
MSIDPGLRRLVLGTVLAAFPGTTPPDWAPRLLADGLAGYTLFGSNIADQAQVAALTRVLRQARPDTVVAIDEEGGDVTRLAHTTGSPYPGNAALGVVNDPALTRQVYRAIGAELALVGITLNLAPTVDVNIAADNPIIGTRSFGAEAATVSPHSAAAVQGLQEVGVAACAKHFPGHGATVIDSHDSLPVLDDPLSVLRDRDLPPFAAAIGAGTQAIMTAHIRVPELTGADPATFSSAALVDLLRREFGFTGAVVTDALDMAGAAATAGGLPAAAVRALAAGSDLLCLGAEVDAELVEVLVAAVTAAIAGGELATSRVEQAVERVAALTAWTRANATPEPVVPELSDLGYDVARRAIRVEGSLAALAAGVGPLVVQLESGSTIAEGKVPWGLAPHVPGVVHLAAAEASTDQVRALAGDRPVIVVSRHLHRSPALRTLVEKLVTDHPTVVVEMGWPSTWRPAGTDAFVTTHGASHANGAALARTLALR